MLASLVQLIVLVIDMLILGRVVMSWLQVSPYSSPITQTIYNVTEPILAPVRNLLPPTQGFDFSPMIVIIAVSAIGDLLARILS